MAWAQPRLIALDIDLTAVAGNRGFVCQNGTMKDLGTGNGICPS